MNSQFTIMQSGVMATLSSDTLIRLRIEADGQVMSCEPLWEEKGHFVWLSGGKRDTIPDLVAVEKRLMDVVTKAKHVILTIEERTQATTFELRGGKVQIRKTARDALTSAPRTHLHREAITPGTRQTFIDAHSARELLVAIGIMAADGEIKGDKRRKYFQIDRFIELVAGMLEAWPQHEELVVLDCGCGKSYLSFALNYYLVEILKKKCRIIGIDSSQAVISSSRQIQRTLNYRNMEFHEADVSGYVPNTPVHMVLSLHACDTATDAAIALGIRQGSKYIIAVPCCQAALTDEIQYDALKPLSKHNVFKGRLADILTDGLRTAALEAHGYRVSVVEYVSPLDTPKNIMLRAEKGATVNKDATVAYSNLKATLGVVPWIDRLL